MLIDYHSFSFSLLAKDVILLPSYKGSTLRGGFGNAFRRVICALRKTDCGDCILKEKCVYSYVFETPPPADTTIMRKYTNAPHPFIIEPPPERRHAYKPGDEIVFGLTLIGRALAYLPYFVYTFDELGKIGIGKDRGKYELREVRSQESGVNTAGDSHESRVNEAIYDSQTKTLKSFGKSFLNLGSSILNFESAAAAPGRLTLRFQTPTRLIFDGRLTLDLEFHVLVRQLLRRFSLLAYFHNNGDPTGIDFRELIRAAEGVRVRERNLRWYDWTRYSARQDSSLKMGGFVGEITFEGEIEPFMPLIRAGEVLHVGKGTGFGLGKFRIHRARAMQD